MPRGMYVLLMIIDWTALALRSTARQNVQLVHLFAHKRRWCEYFVETAPKESLCGINNTNGLGASDNYTRQMFVKTRGWHYMQSVHLFTQTVRVDIGKTSSFPYFILFVNSLTHSLIYSLQTTTITKRKTSPPSPAHVISTISSVCVTLVRMN